MFCVPGGILGFQPFLAHFFEKRIRFSPNIFEIYGEKCTREGLFGPLRPFIAAQEGAKLALLSVCSPGLSKGVFSGGPFRACYRRYWAQTLYVLIWAQTNLCTKCHQNPRWWGGEHLVSWGRMTPPWLQGTVSRQTLLSLYYAKCYALIRFGIIFWDAPHVSVNTFRIQKKIVRTIFNISPRSSCKDVFKSQKILTVPCLYIYKSLIFTTKNSNLFTCTTHIHKFHTRQNRNIFVERHNFATTQSSAYSLCIRLYNKLPNYLKSIESINKFKS